MKIYKKSKALLIVVVLTLVGMTSFEFVKMALVPYIGIWQSHGLTIVFSLVIGLFCGSVLYDQFRQIYNKQLETADNLRQNKEQFRQSQIYANIGTWEWNFQTDELFWSEQVAPLLGYETGKLEVTYDNFLGAIHPDDLEKVTTAVQGCIKGTSEYNIDHRVVWPDGTVRWLHEKGGVVRDEGGSALKMLSVIFDITDRKGIEKSLIESEHNLGEAQRIAKLGSWAQNLTTGETIWSDERYRIFGFEPGEIVASEKNFQNSIYPDDFDPVIAKIAAATKARQPYEMECRIVRPDGELAYVEIRGEFSQVTTNADEWVNGTVLDITERKASEKMLHKLSRALDQSPSAVFITDVQGAIEYVNPKFTELSGYPSAEVIGENPRILKSLHTPPELYGEMWKAITKGNEWRGELKDRRKNGTHFWAYVTISPVKDDGGKITHYVATHDDISQRKDSEFAVKIALKQADIANRAKTELLANMSHELRTPLNAIIGFSSTIQAEIFGPIGCEKYKDYIGDIADSGQHLLELINDILDVSAIEAGKLELHKEILDLDDLAKSAVQLVKHRAKEGEVNLSISVPSDIANLYADERRMKQIIINLMTNAVKFTQPGGQVSLMFSDQDNEQIVISIIDTGIGMDETELVKAMTQFGQVGRGSVAEHEGTGLGLPLTKGLVELHGGVLTIQSAKGEGTTVKVTIPKHKNALN